MNTYSKVEIIFRDGGKATGYLVQNSEARIAIARKIRPDGTATDVEGYDAKGIQQVCIQDAQ